MSDYVEQFVADELGIYARRICFQIFHHNRTLETLRPTYAPTFVRDRLGIAVDRNRKRVSVVYRDSARTAQYVGDQGCVVLPKGSDQIFFTPVALQSTLPPAGTMPWPMGDADSGDGSASSINRTLVEQALDIAFGDPRNMTLGVVVVHKGVIVGERYAQDAGVTRETQLESWSMGKSLLSTVFGLLVADGTYRLDEPVPVPSWRNRRDPRSRILIEDLLQMSSGLSCSSSFDPNYASAEGYSQHMLGYADGIDIHDFARSRKSELSRRKFRGRYRNCDVWTLGWLIKEALLDRGEEYLSFPQRALFDRIGIRKQILETDPYGNLLFSGCDYGTPRNWARLGLLYLQNGMWNGEQILPADWTKFVSRRAPRWARPEYGGMFWLNLPGTYPMLPRSTYVALGAGLQATFIIPEHEMVVVRMGDATELTAAVPMPMQPPKKSKSAPLEPGKTGPDGSTHWLLTTLMKGLDAG